MVEAAASELRPIGASLSVRSVLGYGTEESDAFATPYPTPSGV